MSQITAARLASLPKWAQAEMARLRGNVEYWRRRASVGPDDSNTFAHPYSDAPLPLGHDTTIQFVTTAGLRINVHLERNRVSGAYDRLDVNAGDSVLIVPRASNSIKIIPERR